MKKIFSILLSIIIAISVTACSSDRGDGKKLSVVATIFPYYDFANNISNGCADVEMLLPVGSDVHSYEPTPSDIAKISSADIFIYNGGESDSWVDSILDSLDEKEGPKVLKMMDYVTPVQESDADHNIGDEADEHIWTSLTNAGNLVGIISSNMMELDTSNTTAYRDNSKKYMKEISTVSKSINDVVSTAKRDKIIVADRFPLIYFTNQYNLQWECAFPGCSSETEPSLARIKKLVNITKNEKIDTVFKLYLSENNVAETVADETGAKVLTFYSCESVSKEDMDRGETYVTLMSRNVASLKEALG